MSQPLLSKFVKHYTLKSNGNEFRKAIDQSWENIDLSNEVMAVRKYLTGSNVGVDYLNKKIATKLSGPEFQVKFASIFCHKKPIINRTPKSIALNQGNTPGCELGDLLTLFILFDSKDNLHYISGSLFQAKVSAKMTSKSQQHLYDDDLDFELPQNMGGHTREMPKYSEGRSRALQYLILKPDPPNGYVSCRHTPWNATYQHRWSTYLDMLLGTAEGTTINIPNCPSTSAWDLIVKDLLSMALRVPAKKPARGNHIAVKVATSHFNNFSNHTTYSIESEAEHGVSILMAIVQAQDIASDAKKA